MTDERKKEILHFGWQVMNYVGSPTMALWLASEGWEGGFVFNAEQVDEEHVGLHMQHYAYLILPGTLNLN